MSGEGGQGGTGAEEAPLSAAHELAVLPEDASLLVIGGVIGGDTSLRGCRPRSPRSDYLPAEATVDDLEGLGIYDLGLVLELATDDESLLGRLRDLHTRRLLVCDAAARHFEPRRMLALGFEHHAGADGAAYLYDRDRFNRERDWNSPENWANPDNFDKYRW